MSLMVFMVSIQIRAMGDVSDRIGHPTDNGQVIPFDNKGQLKEAFNIRLEELQVLDIKFLYGCAKPTIAVLYQDNKDAQHMKTYEVALKDKDFHDGPFPCNNLDSSAGLLIPVPMPLGGVIIIGETTIVYCSENANKAVTFNKSITKAYGRVDVDGSRYLLSDHGLRGPSYIQEPVLKGRLSPRTEDEILHSSNLKNFSFTELKNATRNFRLDSVLGEGGFGCVFKGWLDEKTLSSAKPGT